MDPRLIKALERVSVGDVRPDLTLVLDVPAQPAFSARPAGVAARVRIASSQRQSNFMSGCAKPI